MVRNPVSSSNLKSVGYDFIRLNLEIEFHSGGVYRYSNVPSHVFDGLTNASSKGSYFCDHIKNVYGCTKII